MKRIILPIVLLLATLTCCSFTVASLAATPTADTIEVPVADYSDTERNKAFAVAYKQVINNFSGDAKSVNLPSVRNKLKNISNWVQSYNYTKHADATTQQKLFLQIRFEENSIPDDIQQTSAASANKTTSTQPDQMSNVEIDQDTKTTKSADVQEPDANFLDNSILAKKPASATTTPKPTLPNNTNNSNNGAPTIPPTNLNKNQPSILVWLVVMGEDPQQTTFIDEANNSSTARYLKNAAKSSGIKVIFPTMDLEDLTKITPDDVCNLDIKIIREAAKRYGSTNVVAGCISGKNNNQHSEWLLLTKNQNLKWNFDVPDKNNLISQTISKVAEIVNPQAKQLATQKESASVTTTSTQQNIPSATSIASPNQETNTTTTTNIPQPIATPVDTTTATPAAEPISTPTTPPTPTTSASSAVNITSTATTPTPPPPPEQLSADQTIIYVTNVADLDQYASVIKYIHTFPKVSKIELENISASTVKLKVTIAGGNNALLSALKSQKQLLPNTSSPETPIDNNSLSYNWQPKPPNPNL